MSLPEKREIQAGKFPSIFITFVPTISKIYNATTSVLDVMTSDDNETEIPQKKTFITVIIIVCVL